ncbi:hypothetical protein [Pseudomonas sp. RIT-PI-S]|uniref:hypothetical protein n=1 Tax=Pseudomonas sp. RIT-PI-S TaxID=3035295 RepID=UPI0021D860A4|nr:hypothetical protein [Pseudomonas sp. RIT-PI-S]
MDDSLLLIEEARACAGLFRLGRDVEAALSMVDLFDRIAPLFATAPDDVQQQWGLLVMEIFSRQQLQDWLGVADYLMYELEALIGQGKW